MAAIAAFCSTLMWAKGRGIWYVRAMPARAIRCARAIAEAAGELDSEVTLAVGGGDPVDASSALLIMTLGAGNGDTVEVTADSEGWVCTRWGAEA